jgi:hypothetical protein
MIKILAASCALATFAAGVQAQTKDTAPMNHSGMDHAAHMKMMEQASRQQDVAGRGKDVMPFNLAGTQQVVVRRAADREQIDLARSHLREIREQFLKGDFSGPSHIHGQEMPGLAELKASRPGQIAIAYKDVRGGGQLSYTTRDAQLVTALHKWFDAQLSDHGKDAKAAP